MSSALASAPIENHRGADEALPVGTRLDEFEVRGLLGIGGFGIVYRAWDHALEREVALKEYLPIALAARGERTKVSLRSISERETFAAGLRSFVNEARLLARFDHPALVKVHRFWEDNGTAYMVMPLYRGRTLRQVRHAMTQPPDEATCRRVIDPLLSALDLLHREDVFHRDIAPDNILVADDGTPVLLDFGAARKVVSSTQSVTAILKPSFAPLEQYGDVPSMHQGAWTDLYSLGATVHYLLTGQAPPPAAGRALCDEFAPLATRGLPGCSAVFLQAVDWTLALRPQDRPQNVAALRAALDGRATAPRSLAAPSAAPTATADFDPTQPVRRTPAVAAKRSGRSSKRVWVALAGTAVLAVGLVWAAKRAPPAKRIQATVPQVVAPQPAEEPRGLPDPLPAGHRSPAERPVTPPPWRRALESPPQQAAAVMGPRERCMSRTLVPKLLCVKRECLRSANREHPDCKQLEAMEQQAQREREQQEP